MGFENMTIELGMPENLSGALKTEPVDTQAELTKRPTFTIRAFTKRAFTKQHLRNDIYEIACLSNDIYEVTVPITGNRTHYEVTVPQWIHPCSILCRSLICLSDL